MKNKKTPWKNIVASLGAVGLVAMMTVVDVNDRQGDIVVEQPPAIGGANLGECPDGVILDVEFDQTNKTTQQLCLTHSDYDQLKVGLLNEYSKGGDYDFDINHRELLGAVLNHEIKGKQGLVLSGDLKNVRKELMKLLE